MRGLLLLFVLLWVMSPFPIGAAETLTPSEKRGEKIYFTGMGAAGEPVRAYFGAEQIPVSGELAICSSCHGYDGLGRPESGILPSNITWESLTKSYGHIHASGIHHPPYNATSLKQLLLNGELPGGERVDPSMPIYDLKGSEMEDLLAYLKRLDTLQDSGVGPKTLRIGILSGMRGGRTSGLLATVVDGVFAEANAAGGLYNRQLELVPIPVAAEATDLGALTSRLLAADVFALVSPFLPGAEDTLWAAARAIDISVIGPYSLYPPSGFGENRKVFSLFPGVDAQILQLQSYVAGHIPGEKHVALVYETEASLEQVADTLRQRWQGTDWEVRGECRLDSKVEASSACVDSLRRQQVGLVVFLGFQDHLSAFLQRAADVAWAPYILSSGVLAGAAPAQIGVFEGEVLLSYPTLSRDRQPLTEQKLKRIAENITVSTANIQAATSAFVSARLLVEALQRSGRDLDRRKFAAEFEKFYRHETGLTPPLTFTSNRRIGTGGIYVVRGKSNGQGEPVGFSFEWFEGP